MANLEDESTFFFLFLWFCVFFFFAHIRFPTALKYHSSNIGNDSHIFALLESHVNSVCML